MSWGFVKQTTAEFLNNSWRIWIRIPLGKANGFFFWFHQQLFKNLIWKLIFNLDSMDCKKIYRFIEYIKCICFDIAAFVTEQMAVISCLFSSASLVKDGTAKVFWHPLQRLGNKDGRRCGGREQASSKCLAETLSNFHTWTANTVIFGGVPRGVALWYSTPK